MGSQKNTYLKRLLFLVLIGLTGWVSAQGSGTSLTFDGTNEWIDAGNDASVNIGGDITIEAWVYITSTPGGAGYVIAEYADNGGDVIYNTQYSLRIINSSGIRLAFFHESGGSNIQVNSNQTLTTGTWHHVAVRRNVSFSLVNFLVDGVAGSNLPYSGNPDGGSSAALAIGGGFSDGGTANSGIPDNGFFAGQIDELRIWDVVVSAVDIQNWMCKKVTSSHTNFSNFQGYWKLDDGSGTTATDSKNSNDGTLTNMESGDWVTSGAYIGDASIANYASPASVNLAHPDGDDLTVGTITGSPAGVHIFRVDEAPNSSTATGFDHLSTTRYWGVFVVGGTSPTWTTTYNYEGHPGIGDETQQNQLALAKRDNNSITSWSNTSATLSTAANTLTKTGENTNGEYIIGSTTADNPLPVSLLAFEGSNTGNQVSLSWSTASEVENSHFIIERASDAEYSNIGAVDGNGNSNQTIQYQFIDENVLPNETYQYRLSSVDFNGRVNILGTIEVAGISLAAGQFSLIGNYPNPFNPMTKIRFNVPENNTGSQVQLNIYDIRGNLVTQLLNGPVNAGINEVEWNGNNLTGNKVSSGVYIYTLRSANQTASGRMLLMR